MKKIFIGTKNYEFPSSWNELTKDQLLFISQLFLKNLTKEEFVIHLTVFFSKLNIIQLSNLNPLIFEKLEHQYDWIWKKQNLTTQHFSVIRFGLKKLYGPAEGFSAMSYEQFIIFAESYYQLYIETKKEEHLNKFIASLYTLEKNKFNVDDFETITKKVSKLSATFKQSIVFFYIGNREYIGRRYEKIFPKGKSETAKKQKYDFLKVIEILNKEDVSKNNEIKRTNIHEVFTHLINIIEKDGRHSKTTN